MYVRNGKSYDVGLNGDYIGCPWASFWMTKVTVFDVIYVENGKSYDVGPNEHDFRSYRQQQPIDLCQKSLALLLISDIQALWRSGLSLSLIHI